MRLGTPTTIIQRLQQISDKFLNPVKKVMDETIRETKQLWMSERCREIIKLQEKHDDNFNVNWKVKETTGKTKQNTSGNITNENGNKVFETEE